MDQPRPYRNLLAVLWLVPALVIIVPAIILLGLIFYARALLLGLASIFRFLLGGKTLSPQPAVQPPQHVETGIATRTNRH